MVGALGQNASCGLMDWIGLWFPASWSTLVVSDESECFGALTMGSEELECSDGVSQAGQPRELVWEWLPGLCGCGQM